jgi:hypothetical protein
MNCRPCYRISLNIIRITVACNAQALRLVSRLFWEDFIDVP